MKKVFISMPFRGLNRDQIERNFVKMHKIAEAVFGETLEPVHNYFEAGDDNEIICNSYVKNPKMLYMSRAFENMSECDYFIGIEESIRFHGCNIEREAAEHYVPEANQFTIDEHYLEILPTMSISYDIDEEDQ